jgi:hypothetical protein
MFIKALSLLAAFCTLAAHAADQHPKTTHVVVCIQGRNDKITSRFKYKTDTNQFVHAAAREIAIKHNLEAIDLF